MMTLKDKCEELIYLLLAKRDFITSETLARELKTSRKTIYRWVKRINEESPTDGPLISSEKGRGYKLNYDNYLLLQQVQRQSKYSYSPQQRRHKLKQFLLLQAPKPVPIIKLMEAFFVGESVLLADERLLSSDLAAFHLNVLHKNRTLAILGKERDIRRAILDNIQDDHILDLLDVKRQSALDIDEKDAAFIIYQLEMIEGHFSSTIPYPYNINIFLHLYILMQRLRKRHTYSDETDLEGLQEEEEALLALAKEVMRRFEAYLQCPVPDIESHYLYQYLAASRLEENNTPNIVFSQEVTAITQTYLSLMNQKWPFDTENQTLFLDLANHIKPMLKRLEQQIVVGNGLLRQIKLVYPEIFAKVCQTSKEISHLYHLRPISDDENGFITLYFAKLLEMSKRKLRTLIVCTTGIGISELLCAKISNQFSELDIVDVIASREIDHLEESYANIDLLISTIPLKASLPYHFLLVNGMFTAEDQERLRQKIGEIKNEQELNNENLS